MKIPCFYITIIIDIVNGNKIVFPKIIESFIVDECLDKYIVQSSKTNAHLTSVKKSWVFLNNEDAQCFLLNNQELQERVNQVLEWFKTK